MKFAAGDPRKAFAVIFHTFCVKYRNSRTSGSPLASMHTRVPGPTAGMCERRYHCEIVHALRQKYSDVKETTTFRP